MSNATAREQPIQRKKTPSVTTPIRIPILDLTQETIPVTVLLSSAKPPKTPLRRQAFPTGRLRGGFGKSSLPLPIRSLEDSADGRGKIAR